jgi:epoxyqueuosine reductase
MSEAIKRLAVRTALELGAGAVRVTSARTDAESRHRMEAAFERGDFACWAFDRDYARRATDPSALRAGARSVICVALPYATPGPADAGPLRGRVSNYAWSADYHRRLRALLDTVARRIDEAAGEQVTSVACDTKPLAERALAARAGLGWVGKHTNLIAPGLGSFIFLGEIVTTLALAPDAPLVKTCGSCVRCIAACPTRALRGDYTIDANRCISDLTQRTDAIPLEMRALLGDWVWGCDICQIVCPPTREAANQGDVSWAPHDLEVARPRLTELLSLRSGRFKRRYRATAMGWRGGAVLRRNAAVALGNALDRSAVEALRNSLRGDPHPMVRGHAAWALGRIGSPAAIEALQSCSGVERSGEVRGEILTALAPFSRPYAGSAREEA